MNIIKIIASYVLGIICVHIFLSFPLVIMILIMVFNLDEKMSALIYLYISGGLITYLFYYIFTRKRVKKLFLYCWVFVGVMIVSFFSYDVEKIINKTLYTSFLKPIVDFYYSHYHFKDAFTLILLYVLCSFTAFLLYLIVNSCLTIRKKISYK